ncbi:MAG: hypothetical protein LC793_10755 [Thermomicrobia bacterium]|nr:hypothetical protein [Thermomicrobia bacterium]
MQQSNGSKYPGYGFSERYAECCMDDTRLGLRLERAYAARDARIAPSDDALAKLNATLDAIGSPAQHHAEHRYLLGACMLAALLLLLLSPVVWSDFAANARHATRSVAAPVDRAVGGSITTAASSESITPPVAVAANEAASVIPTNSRTATSHLATANGTTLTAATSETPLRDLLARAGIYASDPPNASASESHPPQH